MDIQKMIGLFTEREKFGYIWPDHLHSAFVIELL
jgi:hypothetical protein